MEQFNITFNRYHCCHSFRPAARIISREIINYNSMIISIIIISINHNNMVLLFTKIHRNLNIVTQD